MKLLTSILPVVLLACIAAPASAKDKPPQAPAVTRTQAWIDLSRHWRELSRHWAEKVYSSDALKVLNQDIIIALGALPSAEEEFTASVRTAVADLTNQRVAFVRQQRYQSTGVVALANLEYYVTMARTALENDLSMLLWPPQLSTASADTLRANARQDILLQLDLLQRASEATRLIAQHRAAAEKKEADKKPVDWNRFALQSYRQTQTIIDDYNARRPRPSKDTKLLHKLVLSLIEEPLPTSATAVANP
jgi:hypothetical protein